MPPTGTYGSMVSCSDGDLGDGELEKAKPSPGDSWIAAGPGPQVMERAGAFGRTEHLLGAPSRLRPRRGEVTAGAQPVPGCSWLGEHPGVGPPSRRALPWQGYRELLTGLPGRGFLPPPSSLLFSLCVSPALSSSQSVSKQFPFR